MRSRAAREGTLALLGLALLAVVSCSSDRGTADGEGPSASSTPNAPVLAGRNVPPIELRRQAYVAAPADTSRSIVQREPLVEVSHAESSRPLSSLRAAAEDDDARETDVDHAPRRNPNRTPSPRVEHDAVLQTEQPTASLPAPIQNFRGQGKATSPSSQTGTPPDTNGAVGPNHYVQVVNGGIAVWDKSGNLVTASRLLNVLWAGYTGTNAGNSCATNNDGDPVVVYDQLADRWFVTQFSLPNANSGPNFQCVAVSKTADPSGAYWLYDFQYAGFNDYGKFGMWPDAYYATFNMFGAGGGAASDVCAYDRKSMLAGQAAAQVCFTPSNGAFGLLPVDLDGPIAPPIGEPAYALGLGSDSSSVDLYQFHVDWTNTANSALTGPTNLPVAAFTALCDPSGTCVPAKSGNAVDSLADRAMFRLSYRNFGTHEALVVNHSVSANSAGGVRWYEIRSPASTPVVYQQGTYAPTDGLWRWMGSLAQDQAEDFALGFSISGAAQEAGIGWTGRIASDALGVMGQGETVFESGTGAESGSFSNGQTATRWGDYSNMTVDPADDCTFWYTQEDYLSSGTKVWDTKIASMKFPGCAANDFTVGVTPATGTVPIGGQGKFTVTTASSKGTPESIVLNVQDLATGVTAAFNPATVTAGATSTLTLTAATGAPASTSTLTVIGTAPSAVHAAKANVNVTTCAPKACPTGTDCGTIDDGCGGMTVCGSGAACATPKSCGGGGTPNVCGCTQTVMCAPGQTCGTVMDPCMGAVSCGTCAAGQTCMGGTTCVGTASDGGAGDSGTLGSHDGGHTIPSDGGPSANNDSGGASNSSGCGCRTAQSSADGPASGLAFAGLGLAAALAARRRSRRAAR